MTVHHRLDDLADLPWAAGFDIAGLAATALAEPDVESRHGELIGAHPYGWVRRDSAEVDESWRRQCLLMDIGGNRVRFQARLGANGYGGVNGDQGPPAGGVGWPLPDDLLIAGSVRGPAVYYVGDQLSSRDRLSDRLVSQGVRIQSATLVDRAHAWTEPAVLATGDPTGEVRNPHWQERFMDSCRRTGIDTIVRVRRGRWEVLTLASGAGNEVRVLTSDPCSITRDVERRCPMLREPLAGEHCHMHGGPWTSSSISAAAAWKDHQQRLVGATGCDTCRGETYMLQGKLLSGGGPIALFPVPEPTRWLVADTRSLVMEAGDEGVE